jgi:hypothetical protein
LVKQQTICVRHQVVNLSMRLVLQQQIDATRLPLLLLLFVQAFPLP